MPHGTIIILNGTSSAGKSTIAKILQDMLVEPYLHIGIDTFVFALPRRYLNPPFWYEIYEYIWPEAGSTEGLAIRAGVRGHQLMSAMHNAIAGMARSGFNVIVDHVLLDQQWLKECAELFADYTALFVGVRCPLEVVEQRERNRRDRTLGQARAQYDVVHAHAIYDVEVDTALLSPEECAQRIRQHLHDGQPPNALRQLRTHLAVN